MVGYLIFLLTVCSHIHASIAVVGLDGQERLFPKENQLLFIGSSKKSYEQLKSWFEAIKEYPEVAKSYHIVAVPVVRGFLSAPLFRSGCASLMSKMVPDKYLPRVVPVFDDGGVGFRFFSPFQEGDTDNLTVVLINQAGEAIWRATGSASTAKIKTLPVQLNT